MLLTNLKNIRLNQVRRHKSTSNLEWPTGKVRQTFLDYFCKKNGHKFIRSSSVLPRKGSGTYFTNAGMNQFKSIILGEMNAEKVVDFSKYIGVANSQKCIRIGGKHNDLDDIGKDTYHHTFFEMLGNWSFNGSYTNEKACQMALDLLVNHYKLNVDGLYFTYFCGNKELGLESDLNTKNIWLKLGIPERQIMPFDMKANFWEMDQIGPCGPCTEIHYDRLINSKRNDFHKSKDLVNAGTERVIELWNIVFMNYNRINKNTFSPLQNPVIDTGMGLERLTAVLNNLSSNYDSDAFKNLFSTIHKHSSSNLKDYKSYALDDPISIAYRTLSDYMRSITVSIGDGLMPSRNGLGGFLKYLILNSLKMSRDIFDVERPTDLLCDLVSDVEASLSSAYPELKERKSYIQQVIKQTDQIQKTKQTIWSEVTESYLKKLNLNSNEKMKLSGDQIWKLYKGDGRGDEISIDFIQQKLTEKNIDFDMHRFNQLYLAHNEKAIRNQKQTQNNQSADLIANLIDLANEIKHLPKTIDSYKYDFKFDLKKCESNYNEEQNLKSKIISLAVRDNKIDKKFKLANNALNDLNLEKEYLIVLEKTNFYSESGGQSSDKGYILNKNFKFEINDCYNIHGYTFHVAKLIEFTSSNLNLINQECELTIDPKLRYNLSLNHTGVHLLNHSIRKVFNDENSIMQVHSSVRNDSFKFEFKPYNKLFKKLDLNTLEKIQQECQTLIEKSLPVYIENDVDLDNLQIEIISNNKLRKLKDILYPDKVRIVSVGAEWKDLKNSKNDDYSAELCCGTHVSNTSQLNDLIITNMNIVGDSSFEIQATSGRTNTAEIIKNDELCRHYLNEMKLLYTESISKNYSELDPYEKLKDLNEMADISARIENIFKSSRTSYLTQQKIKEEAIKYRPSKHQLQMALKKHFEYELVYNSPKAINSAVIASINPKSNLSIKFLAFDSLLHHDQIISILNKIDNIHPALIIYNSTRECYYFYSKDGITKNEELKSYFDMAQEKMNSNKQSSLIESNDNFRIIKCPLRLNKSKKMEYFNF